MYLCNLYVCARVYLADRQAITSNALSEASPQYYWLRVLPPPDYSRRRMSCRLADQRGVFTFLYRQVGTGFVVQDVWRHCNKREKFMSHSSLNVMKLNVQET